MLYNPIKLFFSPTHPRWSGIQRLYFPLVLAKIIVFIALLVLCIIEAVQFQRWASPYFPRTNPTKHANFWVRWALLLIIPEGIHIIVQVVALTWKNACHPSAALMTSCLFFCLWTGSALLNSFHTYSSELFFARNIDWANICYGESGLQALGAVLYIGMITFSSIAVHKNRKEEKKQAAKLDKLNSDSI